MKRGTPEHPKTIRLAVALGIPRPHAVGLLEMLWHFTARFAPRGDVGRWPDEEIAAAICWGGDPAALIEAMAKERLLDRDSRYRLLVHDWKEHADQAVRKYMARNKLTFAKASGRRPDKAGPPLPLPLPLPEPLPSPVPSPAACAVAALPPEHGDGATETDPGKQAGNPLVGKAALIAEGYGLIGRVAKAADLDPTEVLSKASEWRGRSYVRLDVIPDDRLAHTLNALRSWWRRLSGEIEPGPPSRGSPSPTAKRRMDRLEALATGRVPDAGERAGLDAGNGGTGRVLPGARRGAGGDGPPGAGVSPGVAALPDRPPVAPRRERDDPD